MKINDEISVWMMTALDFNSLTKLMVSHDLLHSTVTNQVSFDQQDSKSISNFDGTLLPSTGLPFSCLVSELETLDTISFNLWHWIS